MAWGLEEEDGEVFIIINGKKVVSTETLEEFGPVEYVDPGRSADELWVGTLIFLKKHKCGYFIYKYRINNN